MNISEVTFMNRKSAGKIIFPPQNSAIISISTPSDKPAWLSSEWKFVHRACFNDSESWENQRFYPSPSEEDAQKIFDFIRIVVEVQKVDNLVVHCDAGISRSGAVATFVAEKYGVKMLPPYAPHANRTLLKLLQEQDFIYKEDLKK